MTRQSRFPGASAAIPMQSDRGTSPWPGRSPPRGGRPVEWPVTSPVEGTFVEIEDIPGDPMAFVSAEGPGPLMIRRSWLNLSLPKRMRSENDGSRIDNPMESQRCRSRRDGRLAGSTLDRRRRTRSRAGRIGGRDGREATADILTEPINETIGSGVRQATSYTVDVSGEDLVTFNVSSSTSYAPLQAAAGLVTLAFFPNYAAALTAGDTVGPSSTLQNTVSKLLAEYYQTGLGSPAGDFVNVSNAYMGISFRTRARPRRPITATSR